MVSFTHAHTTPPFSQPEAAPALKMRDSTAQELKKYQDVIDSRFDEIKRLVQNIVSTIDFTGIKWFNESWLETQIKTVPDKLEQSLLRWKKMYLDALRQMNEAHETHISPIIKDSEIIIQTMTNKLFSQS